MCRAEIVRLRAQILRLGSHAQDDTLTRRSTDDRLIAQHFAKEGKEEDVAAALREMSAYCNSDAEPGCVMYVVNRSTENPRHFLLYEQYVDEAALAAHAETAMFGDDPRRECRCWSPASGRSGRSWSRRIGRSEEHHWW